jgi:hypothetical protein
MTSIRLTFATNLAKFVPSGFGKFRTCFQKLRAINRAQAFYCEHRFDETIIALQNICDHLNGTGLFKPYQ